ncbi:MAG: tetratricopeptide repeat protein [Proteobacteria bacterium]|nr:tetratricopeptide repeat protein [Pseudomonadota bacterium]
MKPCNLSSSYLDRRLSKAEHRAFEIHLRSCDKCRETVHKWQDFERSLNVWARMDEPVAITAGEAHGLIERASDRGGKTFLPIPRKLTWAAAATMTACLIYLFVQLDNQSPTSSIEASNPLTVTVKVIIPGETATQISSPKQGETLESPRTGRLQADIGLDRLGLSSDGRIRLLSARTNKTHLELLEGTVACSVAPRKNGGEFTVKAGNYSVRVIGTKFSVTRGPHLPFKVSVAEGTVEVQDRSGMLWRVSRGETLTIHSAADVDSKEALPDDLKELAQLLETSSALSIEPPVLNREGEPPVQTLERPETIAQTDGKLKESKTKKNKRRVSRDAGTTNSKSDGETHISIDWSSTSTVDPATIRAASRSLKTMRQWIVDGQLANARSALKTRLKRAPREHQAWALLADCERKATEWQAALKAYEKVMVLADPSRAARARYMSATIAQKHLKDHNRAAKLYDEYLQSNQGTRQLRDVARLNLAHSLIALGKHDRARNLLETVIESQGNTFTASNAKRLLEKI